MDTEKLAYIYYLDQINVIYENLKNHMTTTPFKSNPSLCVMDILHFICFDASAMNENAPNTVRSDIYGLI